MDNSLTNKHEFNILLYKYFKSSGEDSIANELYSKLLLDNDRVYIDNLNCYDINDIFNKFVSNQFENASCSLLNEKNHHFINYAMSNEKTCCTPSKVTTFYDMMEKYKNTGKFDKSVLASLEEFKSRVGFLKRILGHISAIYCLTLDKTQNVLFTGGADGLIKMWNVVSGFIVASLRGHTEAIHDLSVSYDNRILASASIDKTIRVWCLKTTAQIYCLRNHSKTVLSVTFSPYPVGQYNYLVSAGLDGVVCFWKFDENYKLEPDQVKFIETSDIKDFYITCIAISPGGTYTVIGTTDPLIRVYKFGRTGPIKTVENYGHQNLIECIDFDHSGERFISGSSDGTIRIWSLGVSSWRSKVIDVRSYMDNIKIKRKKEFTVAVLAWSLNDCLIFCADSENIIRTFNSYSLELLSTLKGHTDKVGVLVPHLYNNHLLYSAGDDGRLILWDTINETILYSFLNDLGEQGCGAIYDIQLLKNGFDFIFSDNNGNISLYGIKRDESYNYIPNVQFFHCDYWLFHTNENDEIIDTYSDVQQHDMGPPNLVDFSGIPFGDYFQSLIPGNTFSPPVSHLQAFSELQKHYESCAKMNLEVPGLLKVGNIEGVKKTYNLDYFTEKSFLKNKRLWQSRMIVPDVPEDIYKEQFNTRVCHYKYERKVYQKMRSSAPKSFDKEERISILLRLESLKKLKKLNKKTSCPYSTVSTLNDTLRLHGQTAATTVTDLNGPLSNSDNSNSNLLPPRFEEPSVPEEFTIDESFRASDVINHEESGSDFTDSDEIQITRRRNPQLRVLRPRRNQTNENQPIHITRSKTLGENISEKYTEIHVPQPESYPSEWLSSDFLSFSPYVPQLNDIVYYFVQGHCLYIQELFNQNITELLPQPEDFADFEKNCLPGIDFVKGFALCQVTQLTFIYKGVVVSRLTLKIIEPGELEGKTFQVEYHDLKNVADFLVLKSHFIKSSQETCSEGVKICILIDCDLWFGHFLGKSAFQDAYPDSPFLSCEIKWDTGEQDRISPWDILTSTVMSSIPHECQADADCFICKYFENCQKKPIKCHDSVELTQDLTQHIYNYFNGDLSVESWNGREPFLETERIRNGIVEYLSHPDCFCFKTDIDINKSPLYWDYVAQPMSLGKITQRLYNKYHRSIMSLLFDLKLMQMNVNSYKYSTERSLKSIDKVYNNIEAFIRDPTRLSIKQPAVIGDVFFNITNETIPTRKTQKIPSKEFGVQWIRDAYTLLMEMMNLQDCGPFIEPVDLNEFPGYMNIVSQPMNFRKVESNLKCGYYNHPNQFIDDITSIFNNSKLFNTNPRSTIYSLTRRLSNLFNNRSKEFLEKWGCVEPVKVRLTRSMLKFILNNEEETVVEPSSDSSVCSFSMEDTISRQDYNLRSKTKRNDKVLNVRKKVRKIVSSEEDSQIINSRRQSTRLLRKRKIKFRESSGSE